MPQLRETPDNIEGHDWCAAMILNFGGVDHGMNLIVIDALHDLALAALDRRACIATRRPVAFGSLD